MHLPLPLPLLLVIASTTLSPGAGGARSATTQGTQEGPASGVLDLPGGSGGGFALGTLFDLDGNTTRYQFAGALIDAPPICGVCQAGFVAGTLDDGIGSGPDFRVEGVYVGVVLYGVGAGAFYVDLLAPTGEEVGDMQGLYLDPAALDGSYVGSFVADYELQP